MLKELLDEKNSIIKVNMNSNTSMAQAISEIMKECLKKTNLIT